MKGENLVIWDHQTMARYIFDYLINGLITRHPFVISIAGESGSGKSGAALSLAEMCRKKGIKTLILQQDDYFIAPPKTNYTIRLKDLGRVGPQEVKLDLLDQNLAEIKKGDESIKKPLVIFDKDRIIEEEIDIANVELVIVEGTYTTQLKNVDKRVFIDLNYHQTREGRLKRGRDLDPDFLEKVLEIEHKIISQHKKQADLIIPPLDEG